MHQAPATSRTDRGARALPRAILSIALAAATAACAAARSETVMPDPTPSPAPESSAAAAPPAAAAPAPAADPARERIRAIAQAKRRFDDDVEPHRRDLYRYCRSLTGSVWDAEDLLQETMLRGFAVLSEMHGGVRELRPYLFRTATNVWIDHERRRAPVLLDDESLPERATHDAPLGPEVRDALADLAHRLPPQERAAVLLRDVFGFTTAEAASAMRTTEGAVKAALSRGRARLAEGPRAATPRTAASRAASARLVEDFAAAFTARDVRRLVDLMLPGGTTEVVGIVRETPEGESGGTFAHTVHEDGFLGGRVAEFRGEPVLLLSYRIEEDGRPVDVFRDVVRIDEVAGRCARLRYFYFCPEVLDEVLAELRVEYRTNGIHY